MDVSRHRIANGHRALRQSSVAVIAIVFSIAFIRRPDQSWDLYESWKWQDPEASRARCDYRA